MSEALTLVRGVVKDVQVGVLRAQLEDAVDEALEGELLGLCVVGPDALVGRALRPPAPQVLDTAVSDVRVALQVEEDVSGHGSGSRA